MSEGPIQTPPEAAPPPAPPPDSYRRKRGCSCERCQRRGLMGPTILIAVGVIFMIGQFVPHFGVGRLWPLILIVIGVIKLLEFSASSEGHQS